MACVYDALGVRVTVVELSEGLIPGTDRDLVRPLQKRIEKRYERYFAQDQGCQTRGPPRGSAGDFRRARRSGSRRSSIGYWSPSGGPPTATPSMRPPPASRSALAASSRWISKCAPMCRIFLRSAMWLARRCWHTRQPMKPRWRRRSQPDRSLPSTRAAFRPLPIPILKSRGWDQRNRSQGAGHRVRQRVVSLGRERPLVGAQSRRRLYQVIVR